MFSDLPWLQPIEPYLGNLRLVLPPGWADAVLLLASALCGTAAGIEREIKDKPAGLRTVALICVGATVFTIASVLIAGAHADPGRIAAQVVTGIGFLGAGAIIRERGAVIGLTTGATIWTVAAIGVTIGSGYAAAGVVVTVIIVVMLRLWRVLERVVRGRCQYRVCRVGYLSREGRTRAKLEVLLDNYRIPDFARRECQDDSGPCLEVRFCDRHHSHRAFLSELADAEWVTGLELRPDARAEGERR